MEGMTRKRTLSCLPLALCLLFAGLASVDAGAVEHVLANVDGRDRELKGQTLVEDAAGGMLLETDEGGLWLLPAESIRNRTSDSESLVRVDKKQLAERLLAELGPDFQAHDAKNYVVVFNTTRTYAKWCSSLLERLQKAFLAHWKKQGFDVHEPESPLAVLVFSDRNSYMRHAKAELGPNGGNAIGYYSLFTNRIVMYDLTGMQELRRQNSNRGTLHDITLLLSQPAAEPLVATIVHEATHQIAFNCGLQVRLVDNPAWLTEGLAMYFETPDLSSNRSWSGIGNVNYSRWNLYRQNANAGRERGVESLIATDNRIKESRTAVDAYAASWAWTYFLMKWHPDEYAAYLKTMAAKPLLEMDEPATRLADFRKHFGADLDALEEEFVRRMSRVD
jgi:hypothetical protein